MFNHSEMAEAIQK